MCSGKKKAADEEAHEDKIMQTMWERVAHREETMQLRTSNDCG